jgi:heptosyltransferase-2
MAIAPRKVLLVAPAWLGDAVMAHGLVRMMRQTWPDAAIEAAIGRPFAGLCTLMPELATHHILDAGHGDLALAARRRLGRSLRARGYDLAITLSRSFKAALLPWFAGVPERRGFTGELRFGLVNRRFAEPPAATPTLERFAALLPEWRGAALQPALRPAPDTIAAACARFGLELAGSALALCPGAAASAAKRWPAENFAALARAAADSGQPVWILGTSADSNAADIILNAAPCAINLTGDTNIVEAAALLAASGRVVANDSGLMHLAAAVDTPVLGLYGPTDPAINPPLGARARTLRATRLAELEPERVLATLEAL